MEAEEHGGAEASRNPKNLFLDNSELFMHYQDVKALDARTKIQLKFTQRAPKLVTQYQSLIVSDDPARREMLARAASEGGWKALLCADVPSALTYAARSLVQLAVVDLDASRSKMFRPVVERLVTQSGLLLIVCGNEGDMQEEIWVRQRGAWLYLPGVAEGSNLALLCSEARHIAQRLEKPVNVQRVSKS